MKFDAAVDFDDIEAVRGLDQVHSGNLRADGGCGCQGKRLNLAGNRADGRDRAPCDIGDPVRGGAVGSADHLVADDEDPDIATWFINVLL